MTSFNFSSPPPQSPPPPSITGVTPFKPSIAVVVGVLTTMFSITLLLLLYAKHCKRGNGILYNGDALVAVRPRMSTGRKNSGIDLTVIGSLPIFRFSSLQGQKDGLECAVCLARFDSPEFLRLLPKCKHAFHVECVDTWLDAHSTCPLCRCRVDPEDILLIDRDSVSIFHHNHAPPPDLETAKHTDTEPAASDRYRRISGRHSWAGERGCGSLPTSGSAHRSGGNAAERRSADSYGMMRKGNNKESVAVGCFDRYPSHQRKDGLLLINGDDAKQRFEHRISIVTGGCGVHQRWSDVQPSDLLYLRSEMIICDLASRPSTTGRRRTGDFSGGGGGGGDGRNVINSRSVSEITGLERLSGGDRVNGGDGRERQAGVVSRWLAWRSSLSQTEVRSNRNSVS